MLKRFRLRSLRSHLNVVIFLPLTGGCSEDLDAFRFLLNRRNKFFPLTPLYWFRSAAASLIRATLILYCRCLYIFFRKQKVPLLSVENKSRYSSMFRKAKLYNVSYD